MHLRMDRMKTLRWLLVFTALIYFTERGVDRICRPISKLITQTFEQGTHFVIAMNAESEKDRLAAESFQRSLDRHNKVATFIWKRPNGRDLSERADEFSPKEIADAKKSMTQTKNLAKN